MIPPWKLKSRWIFPEPLSDARMISASVKKIFRAPVRHVDKTRNRYAHGESGA
jgi:hypothetical protein